MKDIEVTEEMVTAAREVLEAGTMSADGVNPTTIRLALMAALRVAPQPERAEVWAARAVALDKAREVVDGLSTAPVKANGYAVDGWKAPILGERTDAILRLAAFLSGGEQE